MNLLTLKKTNKSPKSGDVFVYQLKSYPEMYFWGRVIRTDAYVGGFENTVLIYLYNKKTNDKGVIPQLDRTNLLVAPIATNSLPWRKGYFETVGNIGLDANAVLNQHCFKDFTGKYYDDYGLQCSAIEPIGEFGLDSYQTIDDKISEVLDLRS